MVSGTRKTTSHALRPLGSCHEAGRRVAAHQRAQVIVERLQPVLVDEAKPCGTSKSWSQARFVPGPQLAGAAGRAIPLCVRALVQAPVRLTVGAAGANSLNRSVEVRLTALLRAQSVAYSS
jgi:hypothetical protein